jgi:carbon-monoxide dehydrogenase medium subunit
MYPAPFEYHRPNNLSETLDLLAQYGDQAKLIAGGQTLIPMLKMRMGDTSDIVDIGKLNDLNYIKQEGNTLYIGALTRHTDIANSAFADLLPLLKDCAGGIADQQVRNRGTIGGGLSVADPSGDWPTGLTVLNARVICQSKSGQRTVPVRDFIIESYTTGLAGDELLTEVQIDLPATPTAGAYIAFKRAAAAYPTATAGAQLEIENGQCKSISLALGCAGSKAVRSEQAEKFLVGKELSQTNLENAAELIVSESTPPADARGSENFKRAMLRKLVVEAIQRAQSRAQGETVKGGHLYA